MKLGANHIFHRIYSEVGSEEVGILAKFQNTFLARKCLQGNHFDKKGIWAIQSIQGAEKVIGQSGVPTKLRNAS